MKSYLIEILFTSLFVMLVSARGLASVLSRRKFAARFAGQLPEELLFHEMGASGFSDNALLRDLGASHRTLEIILTRTELWIRGRVKDQEAEQQIDLLHCIALSKIKSIAEPGKFVELTFLDQRNMPNSLILRLKNKQGFLDTLASLKGPPGTTRTERPIKGLKRLLLGLIHRAKRWLDAAAHALQ
jgi:hypothetical protein